MNWTWVFRNLKTHLPFWLTNSSLINTTNSSSEKLLMLNLQDISRLLSICGREGFRNLGSSIHTTLIKNPHISNLSDHRTALVTWNSLLFMYSRCGTPEDAAKLFDEMTVKDTISWNTIISCFLRNKDFYDAGFRYFKLMYDSGMYLFDRGTLTTILSACDSMSFTNKVIHALVCLRGYEREITVGNALITSYFSSGCFGSARRVFEEMNHRNVITWTAMISGYAQNHLCEESLKLFMRMRSGVVHPNSLTYLSSLQACSGSQAFREGCQIHGLVLKSGIHSDLCIESALMDMYCKCGSMREAWQIFESAQVLDEVSMTVILVGFAQNECEEEAIHVFVRMVKEGIEIDPNMVSAILGVFGFDTSLSLGKQIHSLVIKKSFGRNPFVSNGLINMYSKCGELEESVKVFDEMPERNAVSWNSMIAAFARHGNVGEALQLYDEMITGGVEPTDVTFLSLLHACSHAGLVDKGMEFLRSMEEVHAISPRTEHYSCVVDMLGRAGLLDEAKNLIEGLPDSVQLWQALLGACSIHGNLEVGKYAANKLSTAAPDSPVPYILMANIYSSKGRWKQRAETIKRMKEVGVAKETGISWIEVDKRVHSFVVDDRLHPNIDGINGVLLVLYRHLKDEGYVPDTRFILRFSGSNENETT